MEKIAAERSVSRVLHVACGELVELLDATFASVSRVIGDLLVELSGSHRCAVGQLHSVGTRQLTIRWALPSDRRFAQDVEFSR